MSRTRWFGAGLVVIVLALNGPLDHYAELLLSVHMGQHMLLGMVAPPLLLLGAPVTLLLRADPPWPRRRDLLRFLRSRLVRIVTHPITCWSAFAAAIVATHLSPLYELALTSEPVHAAEHALYLGTGLLFWSQVIAVDPLPHRPSAPAQLLYLFLAMPVMAVVGSAIAEVSRPLYPYYAALPAPWGTAAAADQHRAGTMMWEFGMFVIVPVMSVILLRWLGREERDRARQEAAPAGRQGSGYGS